MEGCLFSDVVAPSDLERFGSLLMRASRDKTPQSMPITLERRIGPVEVELLVVDTGHPQPRYLVGVRSEEPIGGPLLRVASASVDTNAKPTHTLDAHRANENQDKQLSSASSSRSSRHSSASNVPEPTEIRVELDIMSPMLMVRGYSLVFETGAADTGSPKLLDWIPSNISDCFLIWVQEQANQMATGVSGPFLAPGPLSLCAPSYGISYHAESVRLDDWKIEDEMESLWASLVLRDLSPFRRYRKSRSAQQLAPAMPTIEEMQSSDQRTCAMESASQSVLAVMNL